MVQQETVIVNTILSDQEYEVLKKSKMLSNSKNKTITMLEGSSIPSHSHHVKLLNIGKKLLGGLGKIVNTYSFAKLFTLCNPLSILSLAFDRLFDVSEIPKLDFRMAGSITEVPKASVWYVDIETKGDINAQVPSWDKIISLGICANGVSYVIPEEVVQLEKELIQDALYENQIVLHNAKFDIGYLEVNPHYGDTMLKHYALFPNAPQGLKELADIYLGEEDWDSDIKQYLGKLTAKENKALEGSERVELEGDAYYEQGVAYTASNGYERIPRYKLYLYNAYDVHFTWLLDNLMDERWYSNEEFAYAQTVYDMLLNYSYMFGDIESKGVRFDVEYMNKLETEMTDKKLKAEQELNELAGREINPRSPKQVKDLLNERGHGVSSTGEAILLKLDKDPVVDKILEIRKYSKMLGTYITGYKDQLIGDRGYPSFKLATSTTGRLGGSGTSLLTMPRDKEIKRMVLPDEGQVLVAADLSQAELRVLACESGDQGLINAFRDDAGDFFDELLKAAYEDFKADGSVEHREIRTKMKAVVYGASFARGTKAIADSLEISMAEARSLVETFIVPGSDFEKWRKYTANEVIMSRPLYTKYGRRFHNEVVLSYTSENIKRSGLSFISQATANDICLQAAYNLWEFGELEKYNARIVTTIHDAIYVSCPPQHAGEIGKMLVDALEKEGHDLYDGTVKFAADAEWGYNMADMEEF